jgi:kynurenine formamidase
MRPAHRGAGRTAGPSDVPMSDPQLEAMIPRVSNWGRWGDDDEVGTVNFVTPSKRIEAAALVRRGEVFSLAIPFDRFGPQPAGDRRLNPQHTMLQTGTDLRAGVQEGAVEGWGYADDTIEMATHAATHWDCHGHAFYDYKMYNDRDCTLVSATGAEYGSAARLSPHLVTRGLLLDFPRALGMDWLPLAHHITVAEIERALELGKVEPRSGDILLLRTGNMQRARQGGGWADYTYTDQPGIGLAELPWLHEQEIAAVAADTWAFEVVPSGTSIWLPVHAVGIVQMGLILGEIFMLDQLAADCERDGVYEFMLAASPLPFSRSVGGPVNPIAIK